MATAVPDDEIFRARILNDDRPLKSLAKKLNNLAKAEVPRAGDEQDQTDIPSQLPDLIGLYTIFNAELSAFFNAHRHRTKNSATASKLDSQEYAGTLERITQAQQSTRDSIRSLDVQLKAAQTTRANKITYDSIANDINGLPTRQSSISTIHRLTNELAELKAEEERTKQVWERRQQGFDRIVQQLEELGNEVREEKSEQERRALLDEDQDTVPVVTSGPASNSNTLRDEDDDVENLTKEDALAETPDNGSEEGEAPDTSNFRSRQNSVEALQRRSLNPTAQPFSPSHLRQSVTASQSGPASMEDGEVDDVEMQSVQKESKFTTDADREEGEEDG